MIASVLPASWQVAVVLGLLVLAVALFASEALSVDITTLSLLLVLMGVGILTPGQAFEGFSSEIIIVLASIFVLCGALQETGVVDAAGAFLIRIAGRGETRLLTTLMIISSALSAFINNTTVTAMLVGPVMGLARKAGVSPSRILMPLAFASILGVPAP